MSLLLLFTAATGRAAKKYPLHGVKQSFPLTTKQTYPLGGVA